MAKKTGKFNGIKKIYENKVVIPLYEDYLEKKAQKDNDERGYLHFHPSSFGDCLRKVAIQYHSESDERLKPENEIDIKFARICDAGHAFHDRMQKDFAKMGILRGYWKCRSCGSVVKSNDGEDGNIGSFLPETCCCMSSKKDDKRRGIQLFEYREIFLESEKEFNFKGNCDGVIELEKGNPETRYVIDFKSINSNRFSYLKKPEPKYIVQVMIYMWLTGVKKSIVYYEDKNKHEIKEFHLPFDEDLMNHIKTNAASLKKVVESGRIPKIPSGFAKDNKPCMWCEYVDFCYKA